jgi:hypothetical protein
MVEVAEVEVEAAVEAIVTATDVASLDISGNLFSNRFHLCTPFLAVTAEIRSLEAHPKD